MPIEERLALYLKKNKIRQKVVSERTGIKQARLSMILNGQLRLRASDFEKICAATGTDPNEIMITKT